MKKHFFVYCCILFYVVSYSAVFCQPDSFYSKTSVTTRDGLSTNHVSSIIQDHQGFIWLGTTGGLNRYDGYCFKNYSLSKEGEASLINSTNITRLFEDSRMNIWIGTISGGIARLNLKTEQFLFFPYKANEMGLNDMRITSFCESENEYIWAGTWSNGINRINVNTGEYKYYLEGENIGELLLSRDGNLWAVGYGGLWKYNSQKDIFENVELKKDNNSLSVSKSFVCIEENPTEKVLWIGGWATELVKYNYETKQASVLCIDSASCSRAMSFHVFSLFAGSYGDLWIGTWGNGLWRYSLSDNTFHKMNLLSEIGKSYFSIDVILDVYRDKYNNIWVGTNGAGVIRLSGQLPFTNILPETKNASKTFNEVLSVCEDNGQLYIGTLSNGIFMKKPGNSFIPVYTTNGHRLFEVNVIYKRKNGRIWVGGDTLLYELKTIEGIPKLINCAKLYNEKKLSLSKVLSIEENNERIYIGTKQHSLYVFKKNTNGTIDYLKTFDVKPAVRNKFQNERISSLYLDDKNRLWIGTYGGVHILINDTVILTSRDFLQKGQEFKSDIINSFYSDKQNNIWIGTPYGLHKLNETSENKFALTVYTKEHGLPDNFINAIEGQNNDLWISTNSSIVHFIPDEGKFNTFYSCDGIGVYDFNSIAIFKNSQNLIYMGGVGGITAFYPDSIIVKEFYPDVSITSFSIMNKPVLINKEYNDRVILKNAINYTDEITLTYKEKEFSFEVSNLEFIHSNRDQYAYKLVPYNDNWVYLGNRRRISFNNLEPGTYILKIKGTTNNVNWGDNTKELKINILPPIWLTWYAFLFYFVVILSVMLLYRKNMIKQIEMKKNIDLLQMKYKQEHEISEMKFRFFTNISHEFRTRLTLIIAPLSELFSHNSFSELPEEISSRIKIINKNVLRFSNLIDQILNFRKAEIGKARLKTEKSDICSFVEEICQLFEELALNKGITFRVITNIHNRQLWFDSEKLEIALTNLISNAIKYSAKKKGDVTVELSEDNEHVFIHVIDNGIGIPANETSHIFERFYRIDSKTDYGSSGIGLALTKSMIELHKGSVSVVSEEGKGAEFIIKLLRGNKHLSTEEIIKKQSQLIHTSLFNDSVEITAYSLTANRKRKISGKNVLIVEDNTDVRDYLIDYLGNYFVVNSATDGNDGFAKALENKPDIIVSDVMMPEMDGYEFCSKIKNHAALTNIPVVLLTAKSADQDEIAGIRCGADAFIKKPFSPEILIEKMYALISVQNKFKEFFTKKIKIQGSDIEISNYEEKLLKKIIGIIEANMHNADFDVEYLAHSMNLSHSSLYRKIKALTGYSVKQFIVKIKMDKAVQLLGNCENTLTQIALEIGCYDIKQFKQYFMKFYSVSPKEYRKRLIENMN